MVWTRKASISAEQFVTGLEAIGFTFELARSETGTITATRRGTACLQSAEIIRAYGRGRSVETIEFLRQREKRS